MWYGTDSKLSQAILQWLVLFPLAGVVVLLLLHRNVNVDSCGEIAATTDDDEAATVILKAASDSGHSHCRCSIANHLCNLQQSNHAGAAK